jgi:hypothetical protein
MRAVVDKVSTAQTGEAGGSLRVERSVRSRLIKEILGIYSRSLPKPRGPLCVPSLLPGYGMWIIPARTGEVRIAEGGEKER